MKNAEVMFSGCSGNVATAIQTELSCALRLLGADSALQSAVNSAWEGEFDLALELLSEWNETERDRIASAIKGYRKWGTWMPNTPFRESNRGCSRAVSVELKENPKQ